MSDRSAAQYAGATQLDGAAEPMPLFAGMRAVLLAVSLMVASVPRAAQAQCVGDCDASGTVAVNELVTCVSIGLGVQTLAQCRACDDSGDDRVAVNELVSSVNVALGLAPCDAQTRTPTIAGQFTPTATPGGATITQCCIPAYYIWTCEDRSIDECKALGGHDRGPAECSATLCSGLAPADGHGICCLPNAAGDEIECEDRAATACLDSGGVVKSGGGACTAETCADVPPPNPDVKCCLATAGNDGFECEDRTASACTAAGGISEGPGTCAPGDCADLTPPTIQCCVARHSGDQIQCETVTASRCDSEGGTAMGAGTCSPDPCNP
jgi:hypothetical protein